MEIRIREVPDKILRLKFAPDSQAWSKQNPPAEFCLSRVAGVNVFVKRQAAKFSGWGLLVNAISGVQIANTPRIISIAIHGGHHYYFAEQLGGVTLDADLKRPKPLVEAFSASKRLIDALEDINTRGYWFSDLCRKNIFVSNDGQSHLIDIDSCLPHEKKFDADLKVSSDYKGLISEFAKHQKMPLNLRLVSGECINQAEMIGLAVDIVTSFKIDAKKRKEMTHRFLIHPKRKTLYLKLFKSLVSNKPNWETTKELMQAIG